jgi:hypothetical protein
MADRRANRLQAALLRERITRLLASHNESQAPLRLALKRLEQSNWPAVIFGGALRDLMVFGNSEAPRDVDVVVSGVAAADLERVFEDVIHERTRFGGLRLRTKGWLIDIWSLSDTWAFRQAGVMKPTFSELVHTTFLNVEAIAADIATRRGRSREIYTLGFFEAIERRVLDINFEPNPYPALCVVRSITTALRLKYSLSRRLAEYILRHAGAQPLEQLMKAQESHYGQVRIQQVRMLECLNSIEDQLRTKDAEVIRLPANRQEQLELATH